MLNLGILTSYNTKCGIAEYSQFLVNAFRKRDDVNVQVFGSKNYDDYKVAEDPEYVVPTFGVLPWNKYGDHTFDTEKVLGQELDVLHVQYEVVLYNQPPFYNLLERIPAVKAITYHDNCIPPDFPYYRFDLAYSHRDDVGVGDGFFLPMGVENRPPKIKTFGLGRSRRDIIEEICKKHSWDFEYSFGDQKWLEQEELYSWLRDSDLIVLYYGEADAAGVSIAARVALSTRRPVIVNNTTWFKDLDASIHNLDVVDSPETLEQQMLAHLHNDYIEEASWDNIAEIHIQDYRRLLS